MKIKKRNIILGSVFIVAFILIIMATGSNSRNKQKEEVVQVKNVPVDFTEKKSDFFVEQLTEQEKEIYSNIAAKLDVYQGGEILLKENISPKSLARISDAIRYNGGGKYWYFVVAYPFNDENKSILSGLDQLPEILNKESISKILIEVDLGESQGALQHFKLNWDKYDKLTNYNEFKSILEGAQPDMEYYKKVDSQIEAYENEIIKSMPKDITQEEAVQYFSEWILKNIKYDTETAKTNGTANWSFEELAELMRGSSKACMVTQKGMCSGLSLVLVDLCNRVGINAVLSLGTVGFNEQKGEHAWVEIEIGGDIFFKDPTYENMSKKVKSLWSKEQLLKSPTGYQFTEHFKWK